MVLATILAAVVFSSPDLAQTKYVYPKPMFDTFFPQPTGKNGFEDYIRASDMLLNNPACALLDALVRSRRTPKLKPNPAPYVDQSYLAICKKAWDTFGDMYVAIETGNAVSVCVMVGLLRPQARWFSVAVLAWMAARR